MRRTQKEGGNNRSENLKKALDAIRLHDEMSSAILSNVSHELRTPVTIAKASLELMKDEKDEAVKNILLEKAIFALERQNSIIENIVQAARLIRKRKELKIQTIDLDKTLQSLIKEFEPDMVKRRITWETYVSKGLHRVIAEDKKLRLILINLIDNAIKFNKEGGKVEIRVKDVSGMAEIKISDTGIGIPEERLAEVFKSFFQLDPSAKRKYGGIGMGLSVVKELIEIHGGRIWVKSEEGRGSSFYFTLPVYKEQI